MYFLCSEIVVLLQYCYDPVCFLVGVSKRLKINDDMSKATVRSTEVEGSASPE